MSTIDVPQHHSYCNFFHKPIMLLLVKVSVHQDMSERDDLNSNYKKIQFMPTVQLANSKGYDTQMVMHSA